MLYIFEHTPLFQSQARLVQANRGMQINFAGNFDIHFNERYDRNVPVALSSGVTFAGVWFGKAPEVVCFTLIDPFLDFNDFEYSQTEHGVSGLKPLPQK